MYGKVFDSIYDGTLYGHWEAIVAMQQLIVLSNADGIVDMTPQAIAARTSIPLEIILKGLRVLSEPDPYTRTPGDGGRRIVLLDEHRPWGWRLVNHGKYVRMRNMEQKRQADRDRMAEKRKQNKAIALESQTVAEVAHADAYADAYEDVKQVTVGQKPDLKLEALEVLNFLNSKTGRQYKPKPGNLEPILARLREGASLADLRAVIAKKYRDWAGDEKMNLYLRPKTLFNRTNFANYEGELANADSVS